MTNQPETKTKSQGQILKAAKDNGHKVSLFHNYDLNVLRFNIHTKEGEQVAQWAYSSVEDTYYRTDAKTDVK